MSEVKKKTVLLVDDSEETRRMYAAPLELEGYRVLEAENGAEGVELATSSVPDLIFMNMAMPKMDGWSAIRVLRGDDRTAAIPVVALTGFDERAARERADLVGSDEYLTKPCEPSRVLEEVRKRLGGANDAGKAAD